MKTVIDIGCILRLEEWRGHGGAKCEIKQCREKAAWTVKNFDSGIGVIVCERHKSRFYIPKDYQQSGEKAEADQLRAEVKRLREAAQAALDELGVPDHNYPAPVVNAVEILRAPLGEV
jgi:hypothetical protein